MSLILLVGISLTLFGGFLLLTAIEARTGRMGGSLRVRFDSFAHRIDFIIRHVDWSALTRHLVRTGIERVLHDLVHATLVAVRFVERTLTRAVRALRERRAGRVGVHPRQRVSVRETLRKFRTSFKRVPKESGSGEQL